MQCSEKKVIFYGAGPYLAKHLKVLQNMGYMPLCICDRDRTKWHKPFCGQEQLMVLPLKEALEKYPQEAIYVTVDNNSFGNVLHYLTEECGINRERIENYVPIEFRLGCPELESSIKFRTNRIFIRCYWRHPGIDRGDNIGEDICRFEKWRKETIKAIKSSENSPCNGCEFLKQGWYPTEQTLTSLQLSDSNEHSFCNFNCIYCFVHAKNKKTVTVPVEQDEQLQVLHRRINRASE